MSTDSLPSKHRAVVATSDKSVRVDEKALPKLGDDDVLLQVKAVTLNPTDWKHPYGGRMQDGASTGSDFAGVVVKPAAQWKAGDRVAGFTRGGIIDNDNGAFAEYAKSPSALLWKVPESTSFEEAAAMGGIGSHTAIYALEKLGLPRWDKPAQEPTSVLIWSGATSVGHYAVQLAKILNLKAYVTASPKWHDELKKLGAHECFDYKDPEVAEKIKKASGGSIKYGLDTISEKGSASSAAKAFGDEGGKLALLLPYEKQSNDPEKVQFMPILIYNAIDGNDQEGYKLLEAFNKDLPGLIEQGKFKSNTIKKMGNSLDQIKEGLDYLKDGKASGEKLAYTF